MSGRQYKVFQQVAVGLVEDEAVDLVGLKARFGQQLLNAAGHGRKREGEDRPAVNEAIRRV